MLNYRTLLYTTLAFIAGALAYREYARVQNAQHAEFLKNKYQEIEQSRAQLDRSVHNAQSQIELQIRENQQVLSYLEIRRHLSNRAIDSLKEQLKESDSTQRAFLLSWKDSLDPKVLP